MKIPGKLLQAWSNQIRSKEIGDNVQIVPNMLLTMYAGRLYPATHDSVIEWIAVDDIATWPTNTTHEHLKCSYYPYHPTTLYLTATCNGRLTEDDIGYFFNITHDGSQRVDVETRGIGRQLRLESITGEWLAEFTLWRNPYPDNGKPGMPWPRGLPGRDWTPGTDWAPGKSFTFSDFTQDQLRLLKGEKWDPGKPGKPWRDGQDFTRRDFTPEMLARFKWDPGKKGEPWEQWPPWPPGKDWISMTRWWWRNSWQKYPPMTIVHYEWSARISIEENINKEPGSERCRDLFAEWWSFLHRYNS